MEYEELVKKLATLKIDLEEKIPPLKDIQARTLRVTQELQTFQKNPQEIIPEDFQIFVSGLEELYSKYNTLLAKIFFIGKFDKMSTFTSQEQEPVSSIIEEKHLEIELKQNQRLDTQERNDALTSALDKRLVDNRKTSNLNRP